MTGVEQSAAMPELHMGGIEAMVLEALDKVASPVTRDEVLATALQTAGWESLPGDPASLSAFVTGPLWEATCARLGEGAAEAMLQDLGPLLRLAAAHASEAIAPAKRRSRTLPPPSRPASVVQRRQGSPAGARSRPISKRFTAPYVAAWSAEAPSNLILIIDDDLPFLSGLMRLLRLEGFDVIDAPSGRAGLMLAERLRPALVITDLEMPDIDGVRLVSLIEQRLSGAVPKVLMLTGVPYPPRSVSGVSHVMQKTIAPQQLIEVINSVLEE